MAERGRCNQSLNLERIQWGADPSDAIEAATPHIHIPLLQGSIMGMSRDAQYQGRLRLCSKVTCTSPSSNATTLETAYSVALLAYSRQPRY